MNRVVIMTTHQEALAILQEVAADKHHAINNPSHRHHLEATRAFKRLLMQVNNPDLLCVGEMDIRNLHPNSARKVQKRFTRTGIVPKTKETEFEVPEDVDWDDDDFDAI